MINPGQLPALLGAPVTDVDGAPLGTLATYYSQPVTGEPVWAGIRRPGPAAPVQFAPLAGGASSGTSVQLAVPASTIDHAPFVDPAVAFNDDHAAALASYYRLNESAREDGDDGQPTIRSASNEWVVRSQEQLRVRSESVPTERVRLRKIIVMEEKTITVTVRREEFQLTREPVLDGTLGADTTDNVLADEGIDLVLHEEQIVVSTHVVPVERVHIDVDRITSQVSVSGEVRKEHIAVGTTPAPLIDNPAG